MFSFYIQDAWRYSDRLVLTAGLRIEKPQFEDTPPENPSVLANYGRSTSAVPTRRTISPRFSFNWDITGDQRNQLRGGFGYFTGTPPFVYLSNAFGNSGLSGYASLNCSGSTPARYRSLRRRSIRRISKIRRLRARRLRRRQGQFAPVQALRRARTSRRSIRTSGSRST